MGRKSKITRLPEAHRVFIERLLREDRLTLDEMLDAIRAEFPEADPPSRSGLGRYRQSFSELTERMREIERMSQTMVDELGDGIGDKAHALLVQAVTTLATNAALKANGDDDISIDDIRKLASAARSAMEARRMSLRERQEIEAAAEARLRKEQESKLDAAKRQHGMSPEAIDIIRRDILGIE